MTANAAGATPENASVKHGQHLLQATVDTGGALIGEGVDSDYRDERKYGRMIIRVPVLVASTVR